MDQAFFKPLIPHVASILQPLKEYFASQDSFKGFMRQFGWDINGAVPPAYLGIATDAQAILNALLSDYNSSSSINSLTAIQDVKNLFNDISGINVAPPGVNATDFLGSFPKELVDYLLYNYLKQFQPKLYSILYALDIIKFNSISASGLRLDYVQISIDYNGLLSAIKDPLDKLKQVITWGSINYSSDKLMDMLYRWASPKFLTFRGSGLPIEDETALQASFSGNHQYGRLVRILLFGIPINQTVQELFIDFVGVDDSDPTHAGITAILNLPQQLTLDYNIGGDKQLHIAAATAASTAIAFGFTPQGLALKYPFQNTTSLPPFGLSVKLSYKPSLPKILIGSNDGSRLILGDTSVSFGIGNNDDVEVSLEIDLSGLKLVLDTRNTDNFLKKIFGEVNKEVPLPFILLWSSKSGFTIKGAGSFEYTTNTHFQLGPVEFLRTTFSLLASSTNNKIGLGVGTDFRANIGPVQLSVANVGLQAGLGLHQGNMGPFDLSIGFKPPTGVGIDIDSGKVKGSGFLSLDYEKGEYIGALALTISDIKLNAIGILNTRLPDGSNGYSLLILITAEFTPIQLGFGFTLNGVGGMLGLHRTMDTDAIQAELKNGTQQSILFPKDVKRDAGIIIPTLNKLFPIKQGRFLVSPMAKIGWGTPNSLLTIDLALVIELPSPVRIAILGVLRCVLPNENDPIVDIKCAFAGIIDFDRKYISFDAYIFNSRIKNIELDGQMALRIFWGGSKEMVLSVGGFHPAFIPSAALKLPASFSRMSLTLSDSDNLKMRFTAYYALTSNTVQLGAGFEMEYRLGPIRANGHLSFDLLFQFNPFYFSARITAGVSVSWHGNELLGVNLDFTLEGPRPWHAKGYAEFEICGFSKKIDFNKTWPREDRPADPRPRVTLGPKFSEAVLNKDNWQTSIPGTGNIQVSLRRWADDALVGHPNGIIRISQKVVPMGVYVERYGEADVIDAGVFQIADIRIGNTYQSLTPLRESFSPSQYRTLNTEKDKLRAPSFEYLKAGVEASNTASAEAEMDINYFVPKTITQEVVIIDNQRRAQPATTPTGSGVSRADEALLAAFFTRGGVIAENPLAIENKRLQTVNQTQAATASPTYRVVDRDQLSPAVPTIFESEAAAMDFLQTLGPLQPFARVVSSF